MKQPIDYARLTEMLAEQFPEIPAAVDEYSEGLLHCEMGTFARLTDEAIEAGRLWQAERYFRFVDAVRERATPDVVNAIDLSYVEYLASSEFSDRRDEGFRRMPTKLRQVLLKIDGRGRWGRPRSTH